MPIQPPNLDNVRIGIIGLGYVGLPLAIEFGKHLPTIGFDLNEARIAQLKQFKDHTSEVEKAGFEAADQLTFTAESKGVSGCNVYIVTVPTPIDSFKRPDLRPLESASRTVGLLLSKGDIVIYESTVYPGATEEVCVPILEEKSGLKFNKDFFVGYSPERINPGDREHKLHNIVKVTSGSSPEAARFVNDLYNSIISAGTHLAASIKVAEAAKVIENTQRDLNIALINELALIFERLDLDTLDVLEAAGTKWNFLPFRPGLVGGHCIGVDPYYLTHKAQEVGYHPNLISAGRRINDDMGIYVADQTVKEMIKQGIAVGSSRVLVMGLTFKENCPDIRNTKVIDVIQQLEEFGISVDVYDPWVDSTEARQEYGIDLNSDITNGSYDGVVVAVPHSDFIAMSADEVKALCKGKSVVFDVKSAYPSGSGFLRL